MPLGSAKVGLFGAAGTTAARPQRGVSAGGNTGSVVDVIQYITINSTGDATDFGNMIAAWKGRGGTSNGENDRGIMWAGFDGNAYTLTMDYITISSTGNASDFGDCLLRGNDYGPDQVACVSNGTDERGVGMGGMNSTSSSYTGGSNVIDYITINSAGNSTDFGDMNMADSKNGGVFANGTSDRGVWFCGDYAGTAYGVNNVISYITITSTGNAADFGDNATKIISPTGCSNDTEDRGLIMGGSTNPGYIVTISYVTISSTGNASDFGDLSLARADGGGCSNGTDNRGVFMGGITGSANDTIDYVSIDSTGDATDFGNMLDSIFGNAGLSDSAA
tara:strand:+ start:489 stop:1490 length:1002 start_codon:yes stop_codon:yes gene_type:complete